ncbi:MAG: TIGR03546 family protein [Planctomycetota bacterium]|nr:TIGR03546 family protein [Planctomycetota bacterium]MDA1250633.1 TIGR03546 family protein [Planctomycetota bacterium]
MLFFLRPLRFFVKALVEDTEPRQMALGFALGMAIGLVPKGNLLAVALMVTLGVVRVNLGVGMLTAIVVSMLAGLFDGATHEVGKFLLLHDSLKPFWTDLYNLPLGPWTSFNNTIVLGSFALGVGLFLPVFLASKPVFAKYTPDISEKLQKSKLYHLLLGGEVTSKLN